MMKSGEEIPASHPISLDKLFCVFLRLGCTAFGGPAAHIALMREEFVDRRKWIESEQFADLFSAASLIPGPTSTELAIYLGYRFAGLVGLLIAGFCFIVPAAAMVVALAWAYSRYHSLHAVDSVLEVLEPIVVSVVAMAIWQLAKTVFRSTWQSIASLAVAIAAFFGVHPLALLFSAGFGFAGSRYNQRDRKGLKALLFVGGVILVIAAIPTAIFFLNPGMRNPTGPSIFLYFLRLGSILYGSGYVLLAFLNSDLVSHLKWLSDKQILDAVAIGQVTPGPVFTTATFIGFLLGRFTGALLATVAIFLPSFIFVGATARKISEFRKQPTSSAFLDGINSAALGLMAAVTVKLAIASIHDWIAAIISLAALALLFRKVNSAWLLLGGVVVGMARAALFR